MIRNPRTTQEKRSYFSAKYEEKECGIKINNLRFKRSCSLLPDSWDDFFRKDIKDRTWKRHRKSQYK